MQPILLTGYHGDRGWRCYFLYYMVDKDVALGFYWSGLTAGQLQAVGTGTFDSQLHNYDLDLTCDVLPLYMKEEHSKQLKNVNLAVTVSSQFTLLKRTQL